MASNRWSGSSTTTGSPVSAHSVRVPRRSVSSRLNGIILMSMKLLSFHDELVADLSSHNQQNDFHALHAIQDAEVANSQLKLGQRVGSKALDRLRQHHRLME